jgi:DNA-3-methyladenine glycosylase I
MVNNAKAFLKVQEEFISFDRYIWSFTSFKVIDHQVKDIKEVHTISDLSIQVSKDLKRRGFTFLGPTIVYSFMQSIGIYNDHTITCPYR